MQFTGVLEISEHSWPDRQSRKGPGARAAGAPSGIPYLIYCRSAGRASMNKSALECTEDRVWRPPGAEDGTPHVSADKEHIMSWRLIGSFAPLLALVAWV